MTSTNSQLAEDIVALTSKLDSLPDDPKLYVQLLSQIEALHRNVTKPGYIMARDWADMARLRSISALLQHGVIQAVPQDDFVTAKQLAECTSLEEPVITRLMRHLTVHGTIELGPGVEPSYTHTHLSRHWLRTGGPEAFQLMHKDLARPDLGDYFHNHDAHAVEDPSHCPISWADGAEGVNWFEVLAKDTKRVGSFASAMQYSEESVPIFGMYPFERLVDPSFPGDHTLLVDCGGGRGQALLAIKKTLPGLRGRLILQDRPEVLASVSQAELGDVEKMEHDFFKPQPIKGARVYYFRRITHDWDDGAIVKMLSQAAAAMSADSRVLINDLLIPDRAVPGIDPTVIWMDYAVMTMGGKERNEKELKHLLNLAGLEHVHTWTMEVSAYVVIEAKLKEVYFRK